MRIAVLYTGLLFAVSARAVSIESYGPFDIYYYDAGEVWDGRTNTAAWTETQLNDIHSAIDEWDRVINNTPARQIRMHVLWSSLGENTLGGSASYMLNDPTYYHNEPISFTGGELAWREEYYNNNAWDTFIQCNVDAAGHAWNFGAGGPDTGEIDFRSVILHELGHSLGWKSTYNADSDTFGYAGLGLTMYDRFLVDENGNSPLNSGIGIPANFNELDAPVYFNGDNATNLYGGLVPIYAPSSYAAGSSLSHLDEATFGSSLMTPSLGVGQSARRISDLEISMMADMGWDVIPEPATLVVMLISGAGFVGIRRIFML